MHEDRIRQVVSPEVDVLFVVDNSCSMWSHQASLTQNFPAFMDYFLGSELDYHIGVVSTDVMDPAHSGRLQQARGHRFITPGTPDASEVFAEMAMLGTAGHWDERGLQAIQLALLEEGERYNAGFFRPDAAMHLVVISDEDDHSSIEPLTFASWAVGQRGPGRVSFSAVVALDSGCETGTELGLRYLAVSRAIRGVEWSICTAQWASLLEELGLQASELAQEYFLSRRPRAETLEVRAREGELELRFERGEGWTYDPVRNSILFEEYVPRGNAEIILRYMPAPFSG